jgi:hypothetical protein
LTEEIEIISNQLVGKHFLNVKRKGRLVTRKIFIARDAREILNRYLEGERDTDCPSLFYTSTGCQEGI